jgi:hypothetical protein
MKWNEWHHLYLGIALIAIGIFTSPWLWIPGAIIALDDIVQHTFSITSPLKWLYLKLLWPIPAIQKLNKWLDDQLR